MRALSAIAASHGHLVSGSDERGGGHNKRNIEGCDLVVYSGAIGLDNEELSFSRRYGIPTMERSDFLALIARKYKRVIAVCGCHGKTTTTAMTREAFASKKPTLHLGGDYDCEIIGKREYFITEACEYRKSFLALRPSLGVVTNIDFDHPDTYGSFAEVKQAFSLFGENCHSLIYNGDDQNARSVYGDKGESFGFSDNNDFVAKKRGKSSFDLFYHGYFIGDYTLSVEGDYNLYNALGAASAGFIEGIPHGEIAKGLYSFKGVKGRNELLGKIGKCDIISDYAHHPTEIAAFIKWAKEKYGRLLVVFQPHTYSRTEALKDKFSEAFSLADKVMVTRTFAAREKGGLELYEVLENAERVELDELCGRITAVANEYDCVALLGAGSMQLQIKGELGL